MKSDRSAVRAILTCILSVVGIGIVTAAVVTAGGCAATPAPVVLAPSVPSTQPASTQPATVINVAPPVVNVPTPVVVSQGVTPQQLQQILGSVLANSANAVTTYGPAAQAIMTLIPATAPYAAILGIVIYFVAQLKKRADSGQPLAPTDLASFALDVEQKVAAAFPKLQKGGAEFTAIVSAIKTAVTASQVPKA